MLRSDIIDTILKTNYDDPHSRAGCRYMIACFKQRGVKLHNELVSAYNAQDIATLQARFPTYLSAMDDEELNNYSALMTSSALPPEPSVTKVTTKNFSEKVRTTKDVYKFLSNHMKYFLPSLNSCPAEFLTQLLRGEKQAFLKNQVSAYDPPQYIELTIRQFATNAKDPLMAMYMPDVRIDKFKDRKFFFTILNTVFPDVVPELVTSLAHQRNEEEKTRIPITEIKSDIAAALATFEGRPSGSTRHTLASKMTKASLTTTKKNRKKPPKFEATVTRTVGGRTVSLKAKRFKPEDEIDEQME